MKVSDLLNNVHIGKLNLFSSKQTITLSFGHVSQPLKQLKSHERVDDL